MNELAGPLAISIISVLFFIAFVISRVRTLQDLKKEIDQRYQEQSSFFIQPLDLSDTEAEIVDVFAAYGPMQERLFLGPERKN